MKETMLIVNTEDADYFINQLKYLFEDDYDIIVYEVRSFTDSLKYTLMNIFGCSKDVIIVTSSSGTHRLLPFLVFTGIDNRIYFPYDIVNFYSPYKKSLIWNIKFKLDKFIERLVFIFSSKIMHKGSENELEKLSFYHTIKNKPHFYFQQFIKKENIYSNNNIKKLSSIDNQLHLVYVGGIYDQDNDFAESVWNIIKNITNKGIHYHIYSRVDDGFAIRLKMEQMKNPLFHYEGFLEHDILIKELSKYDFGSFLILKDNQIDKMITTGFGNKIYDYISAKLPIIVPKYAETISDFVLKHNIGYAIEDNTKLKETLYMMKQKENEYINNINLLTEKILDKKELKEFVNKEIQTWW